MSRLLSTIRWDFQLQFRNGFYYASAFVAAVMFVMLRQLPQVNWSQLWPPIILENLVVNAFYFLAGMVLLEKGEGTLEAQIVTPLRPWEYLVSKVVTLGLLSLFETLLLVILVSGLIFNWFFLILGIMLLIAMYGFYGFFVVARYDSITDFILPSVVWVMGFSLPLLYYFDLWRHALMFVHPLMAPLTLMQAAFEPLPGWQILYGILYSLLWVGIGYVVSRRAFYRFVINKEGAPKK
jgi:fluoroquinolone transport system permease protein